MILAIFADISMIFPDYFDMNIYLDICGLTIEFDTRFPDFIRQRCTKYLTSKPEDCSKMLHFSVTDEEIARSNIDNVGEMEAELFAMTIPLSEQLPGLNRMMTHGVAISCDGKSYIFTAHSGVGKSTHAFLWQRLLGADRVHVINGDKPILWFKDDEILACGSPWSGKEHLDENVCLPLGGICLLQRLENSPEGGPRISRASKDETLDFFLHQIFIPHDPIGQVRTFQLLETLYEKIPVYNLVADMSRKSIEISTECLLGSPAIK